MKKMFLVTLLVVMTSGLILVSPTSAQGVWNTGIDVQNISASAGTVVVEFYRSDGSSAGSLSKAISAWGGLNFYLPSESSPPSGGQYSAVVSADVAIAAVASNANYDLGGADMYLGTASPQPTLSFPLVYRNHTSGKWNTKLIIQNASSSPQTVTLNLYSAGETSPDATDTATIQGFASHTFDISATKYAAFGPYGSATVSGSAPLAGVADNIRNPGTGAVNVLDTSYRAFVASQQGQSVVAPLVYKNYNLWTSGINVSNMGSSSTTVMVTYKNANPNISGGPWTESLTLAGNAMGVFYTPNNANLPNGFYGSAELSSSTTDIVVVVASQRYRTDGAQGVAYEGSLPTDATACVSLPVTHNRTTWKTGINILNMGSSPAQITINYYSSAPGIANASQNVTIPANSPLTVYMPSPSVTTVGFYGAANVQSTNDQPLLVNVANSRAGVGSNYVGINYACP